MKRSKETLPVADKSKHYSFFENVWDVVRQVPKGRVTTYGAIAAYLGTKSSSRMVGWAMAGCHTAATDVPAQRVVNRQGLLTGKQHYETPTKMEELLHADGVEVKGSQVVEFKKLFWDPAVEL